MKIFFRGQQRQRNARSFLALLVLILGQAVLAQPFTHPGCLSTLADISRMQAMVQAGAHPWIDSWIILTNNGAAQTNYVPNPQGTITRNASGGNYPILMYDIAAAYQCALRYNISGDTNYANTSIRIMDAWSGTLTNLTGDPNATLLNIYGYEFACAGELMRNYSGWNPTNFTRFQNMMYNLWVPGAIGFWTGHDGQCDTYMWANWDLLCMDSVMAIGVLCDNTNIYNQAIAHFKSGFGNGNIEQTIYYMNSGYLGQGQEEGRDQGHSGLEVSLLGVFCTIAYNQGTDLFAYENNRVLSLCEYFAKYNINNSNTVPYVTYDDCNGDYQNVISANSRGDQRPAWDLIYNHYVNLKGVAAPWSAQYAALMRPEGGGGNYGGNSGGYDQLGFTTLTASLVPIAPGTPPSGLTAALSGTNVVLSWWGAPYATNYNVKRATVSGGPYTTIGNVTTNLMTFTDTNTVSGTTYYYAISALSATGESANSAEARITIQPVLQAYLKFDENTGTNAGDATGNGWNGTLMNGATWTTGHSNSAVSLNGTTNYVSLATNITANLSDFTIATWVYLNSVSTWMRIFDFGVGDYAPIPTPTRYMFLSPLGGISNVVEFAITAGGPGAEQRINGKAVMPTGGWHHVAVTLSGTVGVLYVDGVAVGTNSAISFTPAGLGTTTQNCIGRSQFVADPYLNGKVDDFRIYNGALSAAQISALVAGYGVAPAAPTNVTATAISSSQINLAWNTTPGATNYDVLRSTTNGGTYTIIATGITATNYSDTALAGGTTYYYVVTALNNGGQSTNSIQASATTLTPPGAPIGLTATGVFPGQIDLSWTASAGATSYNVQSSYVSGGPYVTIATGVTATSYTNSGLTGNVTYYFVVSAVNTSGASSNSTEANAFPPVPVLTWQGAVNTNWDIGVTTNWISSGAGAYYQDGTAPLFNDSTASNPVNLAANVSPFSVTFSNTAQSYTINSAGGYGIVGTTPLIKSGTSTATLNTANNFSGNTTINAGTLAIGGAGNLGGGNYAGNIVNYGTFVYGSTATQTLSGVISQTGALTKNGTGSLILSGVNTYSGATIVNAGSLALAGSGALAPGSSSTLLIGNTSGSSAAVSQSGAGTSVTINNSVLGAMQVGGTAGGYGYYNLSAGSLTLAGEIDIGGSSGGAGTFGQFDMSGGSVVLPNSTSTYFLPNRGAAGESSVVNISGGTVGISGGGLPAINGANGLAVNWSGSGAAQTNVTTISSNGVFNTPSLNVTLNVGGNIANIATLNLINGGTLLARQIVPAVGVSTVNFNGGTLIEGNGSGVLFGGSAVQNANIYGGGATINDNGYSVSVGQNLSAPAGNGLASIPVSSGGAGYVMPPQVIITGGGGSGATAFATVFNGVVTGITITSPGTGYTSAPTVKISGGGFTTTATPGTVTIAANTSGGLTKTGSGTVILSGVNTYTNATVISSGTLQLNGPVLHFSFNNVVGGTNLINDGSGGSAMNGILTGTNVSIVSGGHSGNALMVSNGPASTGYVLIPNVVVPLNVNAAPSSWSVAMWLKTTTQGGVYLCQDNGSWGCTESTEFYLTQNTTDGDGAGTHAGGVSACRGWEEGTATVADGNWHFVVMTCNGATKTQYVDGAVDTLVHNDWNAAVVTPNTLRIGGAVAGADSQVGLNGLIDDVYFYSRALSQTEVTNLMNAVATTSPALPAASAVTVAAGATLDLNGYSAGIAGLNGGGSVDTTSTNFAPTLTISNSASASFSGAIKNSGNLLSLIKTGSGTQTLSGTNTYSGTTTVSNGELIVSSAFTGGGNFFIKDGATLGVTNLGNTQSAGISNLTVGVSGATTLEFLNVSNLTKPLIQAAGSVTLNGTSTVKITGTNNLVAGNNYPLIGYTGSFNGNFSALLLSIPTGMAGVLVSNANSVALTIIAVPAAPAGVTATAGNAQVWLSWNAATNASSYYVKNSTTNGGSYSVAANLAGLAFTNTGLVNGTNYYFIVTATNAAGESTNSLQVSARPVSPAPPQLAAVAGGGQLQFTWPADRTGWRLQVQTNPLTSGLGTNWLTVPNSTNVNQFTAPISPTNGTVFFRLVYP